MRWLAVGLVALVAASPVLAQAKVTLTLDHLEAQDRDLADVMAEIGRRAGKTIVVDPRVKERVTITLRQVSWRDAVDVIARRTRCTIEVLPGGSLLLSRPERMRLELSDADVRVALLLLARYAGRSIVIAPQVKGRVTLSLADVRWDDALVAVVRTAGDFEVVGDGSPSGVVRVGAGRDGAPLPDAPGVLTGTLAARDGDVVRLRLEGGEEVGCRVPAEGVARERVLRALEGLEPGARLVVATAGRPGEEALELTSVVAGR